MRTSRWPGRRRVRLRGRLVSSPTALVLSAPGTNRDHDVAFALTLAGATPTIVSLRELAERPQLLADAQMLVAPGGFSHADSLGAGRMFAVSLRHAVGDGLRDFVAAGKAVIGICNGFQTLVRAGLLPGALGHNASGGFQCEWVTLQPQPSRLHLDARHRRLRLPDRPRRGTVRARRRRRLSSAPGRSRCGTRRTPTAARRRSPACATPPASCWV